MNRISYIRPLALLSSKRHAIMRNSIYGFYTRTLNLNLSLRVISSQYFSSASTSKRGHVSRKVKANQQTKAAKQEPDLVGPTKPVTDPEIDAFYVVRKGDLIGIYKSLSDCQAQVSASVCDPAVGVYKGYSLNKETEEFISSRGLKDALYTIHATDVKPDLFGNLIPCPFQQPEGLAFLAEAAGEKTSTLKRSQDPVDILEIGDGSKKQLRVDDSIEQKRTAPDFTSCILEFDGASRGNPGKAGAGAILRSLDGTVIGKVREGLGEVTNNVAEYSALILGLNFALKQGCKNIKVKGDSKLVCNQVQESWKIGSKNITDLGTKAKELKKRFESFEISYIKRALNVDADVQANLGADLPSGEIQEECGLLC